MWCHENGDSAPQPQAEGCPCPGLLPPLQWRVTEAWPSGEGSGCFLWWQIAMDPPQDLRAVGEAADVVLCRDGAVFVAQ